MRPAGVGFLLLEFRDSGCSGTQRWICNVEYGEDLLDLLSERGASKGRKRKRKKRTKVL